MKKKYFSLLWVLLLCCLLLGGCGRKIEFASGPVSARSEDISLVIEAGEIPLLEGFEQLKSADFSGSSCYEEILSWQQAHPQISVSYTVELAEGLSVSNSETSLEIPGKVLNEDNIKPAASGLEYLPELEKISFAEKDDKLNLQIMAEFSKVRPELSFEYEYLISGKPLNFSAEKLEFTKLSDKEARKVAAALPAMANLKSVHLGSDMTNPNLSFKAIAGMVAARPDVSFDYRFSIFGKECRLMDRELNLSHIEMDDEGALVREVIPCMPQLELLDMDSCDVSDEAMAAIRDDFPNIKVVWRIWFGSRYSVRTDVEKILASKPGTGGELTPDKVQSLKYCTEVKYLDLGHNPSMRDISFVAYMPKLEVCLLPMGFWTDASPLENCTEIEYLEIQTTLCEDISPLRNMKKLKHLNICYLHNLDDISPLYGLTQLERLWIGCLDPVPQEQIDKMQELAPNCEINTTTVDPTEGGWRYLERELYGTDKLHPRYKELREMFQYDKGDAAFNFVWNDPLSGVTPFGW